MKFVSISALVTAFIITGCASAPNPSEPPETRYSQPSVGMSMDDADNTWWYAHKSESTTSVSGHNFVTWTWTKGIAIFDNGRLVSVTKY